MRGSREYLLLPATAISFFPMTSWVCQWTPIWIPVGDTFQKAYLEEWQRVDDGSKCYPGEYSIRSENSDYAIKYEQSLDAPSAPRSSWQAVGQPDAPTWKLSGTEGTSAFWEKSEAPLPFSKRIRNFIHPKQLSPFPERLELLFPDGESFTESRSERYLRTAYG